LIVVAALLYGAVTIYLRSQGNKAIDDAANRKRADQDRRIYEQLGAGGVKIVTFYASPPVLQRGEKGQLCYGVANASDARIEPDVGTISLSLSRCVEVDPRKTTAYTLTAKDVTGTTVSQQVEVVVR
jgi:hypothetical protein